MRFDEHQAACKPASQNRDVLPWCSSPLFKKSADLLISILLLFFLSPLMLLIGVAVRLNSPGPIFFVQERYGLNGKVIKVFKFRTMKSDCEDRLGTKQASANDPRITGVGTILRKTSLDELPQLFNVIRGDMALVGPRPHALGMRVEGHLNHEVVPAYFDRYRVKPGMTGLAQINGLRGTADTADHLLSRFRYDIEYIERQSLLFDIQIMARTAWMLLSVDNLKSERPARSIGEDKLNPRLISHSPVEQ
ncbi:sugar transferase [Pseudoroseomonas sp. WGS1072]|uniref:sugar transferase n=1 Tax=Roseomonas sp. WGS1072 TaxID=3366816 RepID=UPI003BF42293